MSIVSLNPTQAARAQQAFTLLGAGRAADALVIAVQLCSASPKAPDAQQLRGICLAELGRLEDAEQAMRKALGLLPGHPALLANLATLLGRRGQPEAALECREQIVMSAPDQAQAWLDLGLAALKLGRNRRAREALSRAVTLQPQQLAAWQGLAAACRADGDLRAAESALRHGLRRLPQAQPLWAALALVLRLTGRPAEALDAFAQAALLGEFSAELQDARAGVLLEAGRVEEALASIQALTDREPDFVPAQLTRARMLWEYSRGVQDPLTQLMRRCDERPEHAALQRALIGLLIDARRYDEALAKLAQMRASTAGDALLIAAEADVLQRMGQVDQATPLFEQALLGLGDDPSFLNAYCRHLLTRGAANEAAQLAQRTLTIDADNQEAWAWLSTAWRLLGDAREEWLCDYERLVGFVEVEPPTGWASQQDYLHELRQSLEAMHRAKVEPMQQSLRGGSQTAGRLFGRPEPLIESTGRNLRQAAERWSATLPTDSSHPFLRRRRQGVHYSGSWSVRLHSAGLHVNHIHSEGWMSSAYYVALPPSVAGDGDAGCIAFGQPPVELGLALPPRRVIKPRPGHLALFPSYFWHGTTPFTDQAVRLTIAFDLLPSS